MVVECMAQLLAHRLMLAQEAEEVAWADGVHPVAATRYIVAELLEALPVVR